MIIFGIPEVVEVRLGAGGELVIQVQDNVGVRQLRVETDGDSGLAEPMVDEPCSLWRWQLNGIGPWQVQVRAEDGTGNFGEWQGIIR
ncbi:MAG: hypothetical protein ABIG63_13260 [Chloroflexota bacterium]